MTTTQTEVKMEEVEKTGKRLLSNVAGFVGTNFVILGIKLNIFEEMSNAQQHLTREELGDRLDYDKEYLKFWLDGAYAYDLVDRQESDGEVKYSINPNVAKLLLDEEFAMNIGGMPVLLSQDEVFKDFEEHIKTGKRVWWDEVSEDWKQWVSKSTYPMYTRFLEEGVTNIPGLEEKMTEESDFLELACGTGKGAQKIINTYPEINYGGLDGDEYSLKQIEKRLKSNGFKGETHFIHSSFEELNEDEAYDVVFINASMHECRDLEKVTQNVYDSLREGGIFVISDLPFPEDPEDYSEIPNKIMIGINIFESQIDDTLLPNSTYVDLLESHGFSDVDDFNITPTHSMIYGTK